MPLKIGYRLILGGTFASKNRLGKLYSWKEIYVSNLHEVFTDTLHEDVGLSKTQPCEYFVYIWTEEIQAKSEE